MGHEMKPAAEKMQCSTRMHEFSLTMMIHEEKGLYQGTSLHINIDINVA